MKTIWTVSWLIAWTRTAPAGVEVALLMVPGDRLRLYMGDGEDTAIHLLPPCWRPWRYFARLGAAARLLGDESARVRRRVDAAHDEFCRGLDAREERGRS